MALGSADYIISHTGINYKDLNLNNKEELVEHINNLLEQCTQFVNEYNSMDYEVTQPTLAVIVIELIAVNFVKKSILNRESNIINVNEFISRVEDKEILDNDIQKMLKKLKLVYRDQKLL